MTLAMAAVVIGTNGWLAALPGGLLWHAGMLLPVTWGYPRIVIAAGLIECLTAAVSLADSRQHRSLP